MLTENEKQAIKEAAAKTGWVDEDYERDMQDPELRKEWEDLKREFGYTKIGGSPSVGELTVEEDNPPE